MSMNIRYVSRYIKFVEYCGDLNGFGRKKPDDGQYYECHHIVPVSLGGENKVDNLVVMTYRQHVLAHWMLAKLTDSGSMWRALSMMVGQSEDLESGAILSTRKYLRRHRIRWVYNESTDKQKQIRSDENLSEGFRYGRRPVSKSTRDKLGKAWKTRPGHSEETRAKIARANIGQKHSEETRAKMRGPRTFSDSHKAALKASWARRKAKKDQ